MENIENYNKMFEDNENDNGMENTETGDENDDEMRNIESGDESDDKNDDETEDENKNDNEMNDNDNNDDDEINANDMKKNEDNSFDSKLINLKKILSGNLKKISAYDYLYYRAIHVFFKGWKFNNLNQKQTSLYSAKIILKKDLIRHIRLENRQDTELNIIFYQNLYKDVIKKLNQ